MPVPVLYAKWAWPPFPLKSFSQTGTKFEFLSASDNVRSVPKEEGIAAEQKYFCWNMAWVPQLSRCAFFKLAWGGSRNSRADSIASTMKSAIAFKTFLRLPFMDWSPVHRA